MGREAGENGEAATREATSLRENGNQRPSFWYPSGKEQILPR